MIDKLARIHIQDKKILGTLSIGKDTWYIPGGKREKDETDHEALIREIEEELSVRLDAGSIKYYGTFEAQAHGKSEGIIVRMTCYTAEYEGNFSASNEIAERGFLEHKDKEISSEVDGLIFDDLFEKGLIK